MSLVCSIVEEKYPVLWSSLHAEGLVKLKVSPKCLVLPHHGHNKSIVHGKPILSIFRSQYAMTPVFTPLQLNLCGSLNGFLCISSHTVEPSRKKTVPTEFELAIFVLDIFCICSYINSVLDSKEVLLVYLNQKDRLLPV